MKIKFKLLAVSTVRKYRKINCFEVVHDWEDVIAERLGLRFRYSILSIKTFGAIVWRLRDFLKYFFRPFCRVDCLAYVLHPTFYDADLVGNRHVIPVVIDFFLRKGDGKLEKFYIDYKDNPCVLITSKEAFDYLKSIGCPLDIRHWALSLPDKYLGDFSLGGKRYDCGLVGRQSPIMVDWMKRYASRHSGFKYIYSNEQHEWFSSDGEKLGKLAEGRDGYLSLLKSLKTALYITPGMDHTRGDDGGYNQVTPRFLEFLACGCKVLARYPKNSDTDYYELPKMAPNIESYEQFELEMDRALKEPFDAEGTLTYLKKHATSKRAEELKTVIGEFL